MFSEGLGKAGDMWARQRWEKVSSWLGEGNQFPCGLDPTLAQASDPEVREAWTENLMSLVRVSWFLNFLCDNPVWAQEQGLHSEVSAAIKWIPSRS